MSRLNDRMRKEHGTTNGKSNWNIKNGSEGGKALVERYGKTDDKSNFHLGIEADLIAKHGKTDRKSNHHMRDGSNGGTALRNKNHDEHMKKSGDLQLTATFDDCNHSVIRPVSVLYTEVGARKKLYCTECNKNMNGHWHTDGNKFYKHNVNGIWEAHEPGAYQLTKIHKVTLEDSFNRNNYLVKEEVTRLVRITGKTEEQIKNWFTGERSKRRKSRKD